MEITNEIIEKEFFTEALSNAVWKTKVHDELEALFINATEADIAQYKNTYWRWYVYVTWRLFNRLTEEEVLRAMEQQVFDALSLGVDVWDNLIWYLGQRVFVESDIKLFYPKLKNIFYASQHLVGELNGERWTVSKIISELLRLDQQGHDSLQLAQFQEKLQRLLFPSSESICSYVEVQPKEAVARLVGLVHFFEGVGSEAIISVIDRHINADTYYRLDHEPGEQLTYSQIKTMVMKVASTHEMIVARLDFLASRYNDSKINDLYYFNESDGQFHWNEELLDYDKQK